MQHANAVSAHMLMEPRLADATQVLNEDRAHQAIALRASKSSLNDRGAIGFHPLKARHQANSPPPICPAPGARSDGGSIFNAN